MRRETLFFGEQFGRRPGAKYPPAQDGALLMGGRHAMGGVGGGDWVCAKPHHWVFEGTGMKKGDAIQGLVGWEWHSSPARGLPGYQILAESPTEAGNGKPKPPQSATIYDGPEGNVVFNAATIWWAQGLSSPPGHVLPAHKAAQPQGPDERVQRMMKNVFDRFTE